MGAILSQIRSDPATDSSNFDPAAIVSRHGDDIDDDDDDGDDDQITLIQLLKAPPPLLPLIYCALPPSLSPFLPFLLPTCE